MERIRQYEIRRVLGGATSTTSAAILSPRWWRSSGSPGAAAHHRPPPPLSPPAAPAGRPRRSSAPHRPDPRRRDRNNPFVVMGPSQWHPPKPSRSPGTCYPSSASSDRLLVRGRSATPSTTRASPTRDIKPANILLVSPHRPGHQISGFAVSSPPPETTRIPNIGSPAYMSPGAGARTAIDHHADIYSLGVVMCQLLTGERRVDSSNNASLAYQIVPHVSAAALSLLEGYRARRHRVQGDAGCRPSTTPPGLGSPRPRRPTTDPANSPRPGQAAQQSYRAPAPFASSAEFQRRGIWGSRPPVRMAQPQKSAPSFMKERAETASLRAGRRPAAGCSSRAPVNTLSPATASARWRCSSPTRRRTSSVRATSEACPPHHPGAFAAASAVYQMHF